MNLIMDQIGKAMVPILVELALNNLDSIHEFLDEQAQKTTNTMDDWLVSVLVDYLHDALTEKMKEYD